MGTLASNTDIVGIILGVGFILLSVWCAYRTLAARGMVERLCHALDLLMCLDMVAMLPPVALATSVPTSLSVVVFAAAALWFCYHARFVCPASARAHSWFAAATMLAMVWMLIAMATPHSAAHSPTATPMPGMGMPGNAGSTPAAPIPTWMLVGSAPAIVLLAAAAVWHGRRILPVRRGAATLSVIRVDSAAACLMATGMAVDMVMMVHPAW